MGKKHKRQNATNKAKPTPPVPPTATAPPQPADVVPPPPAPAAFEPPLTPPESPVFAPLPQPKDSAPPDKPADVIRTALDHLSLGFPGAAYAALQSALPGLHAGRSADKKAQEQEQVDKQAFLVRSVQTRLEGKDWTGALASLDAAERGWKALGRAAPWEGVRWRLEGLEGAKKWGELERVTSTSLVGHPSSAQYRLYYLALAQYQLGKIEAAIGTAERALKARMGEDRIVEKVKSLLDRMHTTLGHKTAGKEAFQAQKFDEASKLYTSALFAEGENLIIRSLLFSNRALVYLKLIKLSASITDCDTCLSLTPRFAKALHTRSKAHLALGDLDAAIQDLDRAVAASAVGSEEWRMFERERKEAKEKKEAKEREEREKREKARKEAEERRREEYEKTHPDLYKVLDVPRTASQDEIRKAFYTAARQHHPDKGGDEAKFKEIQAAYEVLGDEEKRARYDAGEESDDMDDFFHPFFFFDFLFAGARPRAAAGGGGRGDRGGASDGRGGGGAGAGAGRGGGGARGRGARGRGRGR
ncbi:hypothetical protein JCM6882_000450 [Rhodosporidiobolus microsporus]